MHKTAKYLIIFLIFLLACLTGLLVYLQFRADSAQNELRARNDTLSAQLRAEREEKSTLRTAWNEQKTQYDRALTSAENLANEVEAYLATLDTVVVVENDTIEVREGANLRRLRSSRQILELEQEEIREDIVATRRSGETTNTRVQELTE